MKIFRLTLIAALAGSALFAQAPPLIPVTDEMLANPDPADWLMWRRTVNSWGFSPLNQITKNNVGKLRMVWTRALGPGVQEGTPLVHNGILFFPNPLDIVQAMKGDTGQLLWEYRRPLPEDLNKHIPFPAINRNVAIYGNNIIDTSADDFVYAIDATTGRLAWENRIVDYRELSAQETAGPLIAGGKIFSTRGCEPKAGPDACIITAHDAKTGKELWRRRTIPKPGEPGNESWGDLPDGSRWHVGAWMVPSYDPELDMIFVGTSVTSPAPKFMLAGNDKKYLYHNCTLAIDAKTGKIVWYYQHIVDHWDFDHPFERLLVDTAVAPDASQVAWINPKIRAGERRKVVTGIPGKTGIIYTLDRATGEFLWARPTVMQNVVQKIDGATGEVTVNPETTFSAAGQTRFVCPTVNGGKGFQAGAYSPVTNTMYYGLQNMCSDVTAIAEKPKLGVLYAISNKNKLAPGADKIGSVYAVSAETGKTLWKFDTRAGAMSLVATGSGLIFGGDSGGNFRALDQDTGKMLWEVFLGSAVTGYPITYSVNGKQYVAVSTGTSLVTTGLNAFAPELKPSAGNNLFVFSLGE